MSLYDTPLWYGMSPGQQIALSRHEAAALASLGIWFELILMQLLVRHIYVKPATSAHVRYALTEIADECRHSMMFACVIKKGGTPNYPPATPHHQLARVFKVYTDVGLDRREAVAQARESAHRREVMRERARRLTDFLDDIGVLRGPARHRWRRSGLLA